MIFKKIVLSILFISLFLVAKSVPELTEDMYYEKVQFLIAKSTTSYKEARKVANKLTKKLHIKLNLRGLKFSKKAFLTLDKEICEKHLYDYPCYQPRGRYDEGEYISIEHTNSYKEFTDGYYIVVIASGNSVKSSLKKVKKHIKDAYIKSVKIYMGSMH